MSPPLVSELGDDRDPDSFMHFIELPVLAWQSVAAQKISVEWIKQYQNIYRLDGGYVSHWEINFVSSLSQDRSDSSEGKHGAKGATIRQKGEAEKSKEEWNTHSQKAC